MKSVKVLFLLFANALATITVAKAHYPRNCEISVIGAGLGGLYSAWRLAVDSKISGHQICIFEAKNRPGGRILTVKNPVPGFKDFVVDLGAYRYHRVNHRQVRLLVEDVLKINTLCYTDPLERRDKECGSNIRSIIYTRGKTFGIKADGRNADDSFKSYSKNIPYVIDRKYQWGPNRTLKKPRNPYEFILSSKSIVPEIAERWNELAREKSYRRAMRIVDEILLKMKRGNYKGIPYTDVSLLQAATEEGWTSEERLLYLETAWSVGEAFALRASIEVVSALALRYEALAKDNIGGVQSLVTPVERRGGVLRRIGMSSIIDALVKRCKAANVRIFYGAKVTNIVRADRYRTQLILKFANGAEIKTNKVIANIGKPDLVALGVDAEPMKSSSIVFRRAVERNAKYTLSKTYCFWDDAWWLTKMKTAIGRTRIAGDSMFSLRYHDGDMICKNRKSLTGCRGGLLASYDQGDYTGAGAAIHVNSYNALRYTPLTNTDNVRKLIPGKMSKIEELYFNDLHRQIKRFHNSSLAAKGFNVDRVIPPPRGCIFADWRDVGTHQFIGPGQRNVNIYKLFTKPVPDLHISLVNEAWGQDQGWAESSLNSAERMLYHVYKLPRPQWMDDQFHSSVIRKFNTGLK